jgi:hypothetical protein
MSGGWDVTAVHHGRVVMRRHCADWHRAERARRLLSFELQMQRGLAAAALALALLAGAPLGAAARGEPEPAGNPTPAARTAPDPAAADRAGLLPDRG